VETDLILLLIVIYVFRLLYDKLITSLKIQDIWDVRTVKAVK